MFDLEDMLNASVVITHRAPGTDANGERVWVTDGSTATPAHMAPTSAGEQVGDQTTTTRSWLMVLPAGVRIGTHDRVFRDGVEYGVVGVRRWGHVEPTGPGEHHAEVDLVEVSG